MVPCLYVKMARKLEVSMKTQMITENITEEGVHYFGFEDEFLGKCKKLLTIKLIFSQVSAGKASNHLRRTLLPSKECFSP